MKTPILRLTTEQLAAWFSSQGVAPFRGKQVRNWIIRRRVCSFQAMTDLSKTIRDQLDQEFSVFGSRVECERKTSDETRKLLLRLEDGQAVECVLLTEGNRRTVCVSTQVGCGMGCVFCASGLAGVIRNLDPHEIVEQFLHARNLLAADQELTHAVIMGMGEPLANLDNLLLALEQVCHPDGMNLGQRRVTISTVGLPPRIYQLADRGLNFHLAISLHAPTDELRSQLVPPNSRIGIAKVIEAADYFARRTGRQVTYEYVLLRDINDTAAHANQLVRLLGSRKVHVNLIPYNPVQGLPYATPQSVAVQRFAAVLRRAGLSVKVRKTKGRRIDAACGQLRLQAQPPSFVAADRTGMMV